MQRYFERTVMVLERLPDVQYTVVALVDLYIIEEQRIGLWRRFELFVFLMKLSLGFKVRNFIIHNASIYRH